MYKIYDSLTRSLRNKTAGWLRVGLKNLQKGLPIKNPGWRRVRLRHFFLNGVPFLK